MPDVNIELPAVEIPDAKKEDTALETAKTIVDEAVKLAELAAPNNEAGHEMLRDILRAIEAAREQNAMQHQDIINRLDTIHTELVIERFADKEENEEEVEEAPVIVEANVNTGNGEIEKETVSTEPPIAESRENNKPSRRWL